MGSEGDLEVSGSRPALCRRVVSFGKKLFSALSLSQYL